MVHLVQTHPTLRRVMAPGPKLRKHRRGISLEVRMLNMRLNMRRKEREKRRGKWRNESTQGEENFLLLRTLSAS